MHIEVVTLFPDLIRDALKFGVVGRALERGIVRVGCEDPRAHTHDAHRTVDDRPYGGGPGMVMKPEPFFQAVERIRQQRGEPGAVVLTSPQGRLLTQAEASRLAALSHLVVLCGRYEGIDDRVREHLATEEISIGDYVLSGGELAALVLIDVVARLVPGVVGDEHSVEADSFTRGLLDYPHYTRPAEYAGWSVPDVLLSGHHAAIARWRARQAVRRTLAMRPGLLDVTTLDAVERAAYEQAMRESEEGVDHERD